MIKYIYYVKAETVLNIGFDDTDSKKGMCTTYLAYKIVDLLKKNDEVQFLDFPKLVRFNPNIPWKTRGNGAVGLKIKTKNPAKIKKHVINLVKKFSDTKNGANPGLIFYENESIPNNFKEFSKNALWKLIQRNHAKEFVSKNNIESYHLGNGQGLVGAIGVIGYEFEDHTLELLSYRKKSKFGTKRNINTESVKKMQQKTFPFTFSSYDDTKHKILITPHGPDPVFYGIRGENPKSLLHASKLIQTDETLDGFMIFKSNQGTSDHLKNEFDISNLPPYSSGFVSGIISKSPKIKKGGHVLFSILVKNKEITCAVYKQTGLANIVMNLIKGDEIRAGGGIRKSTKKFPRVLNIEFIEIKKLKQKIHKSNPICKKCNKSMKSKGQNQGFQCVKCRQKSTKKSIRQIPRIIKKGLYLPKISAHRHLTRPQQRIGIKNSKSKFNDSVNWYCVFD